MVVSGEKDYELQVLLKTIDKGSVDEFVDLFLKMRSSSGYKFCPGLSCEASMQARIEECEDIV